MQTMMGNLCPTNVYKTKQLLEAKMVSFASVKMCIFPKWHASIPCPVFALDKKDGHIYVPN